MARLGTVELNDAALEALRNAGFRTTWGRLDGCRSWSVHRFEKDGKESWFLIQARHNQPDTDRYLVGLIVDAMDRVDNVALFFEGEKLLILPSSFLCEIHNRHKALGNASYTGLRDRQWRVDFFLSAGELSLQGSKGQRYDFAAHATSISIL